MKRWVSLICMVCFLAIYGVPAAWAKDYSPDQSSTLKNMLVDTLYGIAIGAVIGAAVSAPQDDPDWGNNIGAGVAIGAVAGLVFGLATESRDMFSPRAAIEIQPDNVEFSWPTLVSKVEKGEKKAPEQTYSVSLLQYNF